MSLGVLSKFRSTVRDRRLSRWLPVLAACLFAVPSAQAARPPVIVIDAGHGGEQEGAKGEGGALEKVVCLELAHKLGRALRTKLGAQVVLTREEDTGMDLRERVTKANQVRPDLFISLHANSMPTRRLRAATSGIETFFLSARASGQNARDTADRENAGGELSGTTGEQDLLQVILADLARSGAHVDSSRLAYAVHQRLIAETGAEDRGVQQAPFFVLMGVEAPAILVEVGFISHPREGKRLREARYQELLVNAIASGVAAFFEQGRAKRSTARAARSLAD